MSKFSIFPEEVFSAKRNSALSGRSYQDERNNKSLNPQLFFFASLFIIFSIFILRLFWLTIVKGAENRSLSEENRIRLVEIEAPRGNILDRHGKVIAQSETYYEKKKGSESVQISKETAKDLEEKGLAGENFEGTEGKIERKVKRVYELGQEAAHVLGYVSMLQESDTKNNSLGLSANVGRLGIEATYDDFLRGENGKKLLEVDARGQNVSILGNEAEREGKNLQLAIDAGLQRTVFAILQKHILAAGSKKGAVIVENPNTGEILALVSFPSFDPEDIGKHVADIEKPFLNRVTSGTYPPGSVFKPVSALAGLESGAINKDTEIEDVGEFYIGEFRFPNWYFLNYGRRDGILKIDRAIGRSNDIFFYRLGEKTGLDKIRETAIKFGFGQKTGIDLPDEALGLVPSPEWKQSSVGSDWFLGDTMHLAIGQGFMLVTPIQVNLMTSFMASGKIMKPFIVTKIGDMDINPKQILPKFVQEGNFRLVREGMRQACATEGTGWPFFEAKYRVGCKTGTAERALGNPHAWFTAFAPYDRPEITITVIIEEGGEGSSVAGPVAKEILDWYFKVNSDVKK